MSTEVTDSGPSAEADPSFDPDSTWGQPRATGPTSAAPESTAGGAPPPVAGGTPAEVNPPGAAGAGAEAAAGPGAADDDYVRMSMAVPALVLSIAGLACCGITAPVGMALGVIDLRAIDRGITDPSKRGAARAAIILGALATSLIVIVAAFTITVALRSSVDQ